ncbi:MAG: hypothetical protein J5I93_02695 [Pirellulaceae bacterium]|nr:hypothetical protein [Pirellulaceae bacterium]
MYLCYDIKGIQKFIFAVPKLKCVIGGSGLIAEFDKLAEELAPEAWIFSGGGRGAFECSDAAAVGELDKALVKQAHQRGLDIRIGVDRSLTRAAQHADRLYPFRPPNIAGHPCALSGLWPVAKGEGKGRGRDIHSLIGSRIERARRDDLGVDILKSLRSLGGIPQELENFQLQFFKNVSPDKDDEPEDYDEAMAARAALGNRNRWAVIAMDGNDMGRQFRAFETEALKNSQPGVALSDASLQGWLPEMSRQLARCTREAFLAALADVIAAWAEDTCKEDRDANRTPFAACAIPGTNDVVLPFRPLILGGDDVVLLCHCSYAMRFVETMASRFEQLSRDAAQNSKTSLWPATAGRLTISAGVLFSKVTFPLHMAIPYAESLLGNAKARYRAGPDAGQPTPAAVDWDVVTDSLLDTPAARRNRELRFRDEELACEVRLTRRPYVLRADGQNPDLPALRELAKKLQQLPPSVRSRILPALQGNWSDRVAFVASLAKRHKLLMELLWEGGDPRGSQWVPFDTGQETGLPDALLLLEEEHRIARPTVTHELTT